MAAKLVKQNRAIRELYIDQLYSAHAVAQSATVDKILHPRLKVIYSKLEDVYNEFEKAHISLINNIVATDNPDLDEEKRIRQDFLEKYYETKTTCESILNINFISQSTCNTSQSSHSQHSVANLPKINLPTFDGNYTQWKTFLDLFDSLIHNNNSLDEVQKFNYLLTSLKNEPLTIVKTLPLTANNYLIAYNSLVNRYQNSRLLSNSYWSKIVHASKITNDSASSLRYLLNTFNENLAALEALNLPVRSWDFVLFNLIIQKLDLSTIKRFELQDASTDIPSYEKLKLFLERQCTALESASFNSGKSLPLNTEHDKRRGNYTKNLHTMLTTDKEIGTSHPCILCNATSHFIYTCSKFLAKSPYERAQLVKRNKWCSNCLHSQHDVSSCTSKVSCRVCKLRHHTMLHYSKNNLSHSQQSKNVQNSLPFSQGRPQIPPQHSFEGNPPTQGQLPSKFSQSPAFSGHDSYSPEANAFTTTKNENTCYLPQQQTFISPMPSTSKDRNTFLMNFPMLADENLPTTVYNQKQPSSYSTVLLATAQAEILDVYGNFQQVRILIDNCSQINIISQKCANRLGLPRSKNSLSVFGVGQSPAQSTGSVNCRIRPKGEVVPNFMFEAVILPKICLQMPSTRISTLGWKNISNLQLADPHFDKPASIDLLLGSEMYPFILDHGIVLGNSIEPSFIKTVFGWIALGKVSFSESNSPYTFVSSVGLNSLDDSIKRFWEIENIPSSVSVSPEDTLCETYYSKTTHRNSEGRYIVSLPFKEPNPVFPGSKSMALRRFYSLEKRLLKDPCLYETYSTFMKEYIDSNYMELVNLNSAECDSTYYIPHHCVVRPESSTTKLRVVMDASARCESGLSLNDTLMTGTKLQKDLTSILLRFRLHYCVFTADIKQMYSQILLSKDDVDYQRLFWRFSPSESIQAYRLLRVSFGVKSSPFLALRTLAQLIQDEGGKFPMASVILNHDVFVDDTVTGFATISEAVEARDQLISLLKLGGFELRKWASNCSEFLADIPSDHLQNCSLNFDSSDSVEIKILGLKWNPKSDSFSYSVQPLDRKCTKRNILSELARIYDPLGFLSPLTFFAKYLIQHLWLLGLEWDEEPPTDVLDKWFIYKKELPLLSKIQISRFLFSSSNLSAQIHGFSDSSEKGYAAVVYIRSFDGHKYNISLVCAKSKVSPTKKISIPRLELCGALLLSQLMSVIIKLFSDKVHIENVYAWTDSSIVLCWLKGSPHRWKSFVSNRVTQIQEKVSPSLWHHVRSEHNPADKASRGLLPSELISCKQWWSGPEWLILNQSEWPIPASFDSSHEPSVMEEEKKVTFVSCISLPSIDTLLLKHSSLRKVQLVICYVLRFIHNAQFPNKRKTGKFIHSDFHEALMVLVKRVQHTTFSEEISNLEKGKVISKSLRSLNPFIGEEGVLRVGGRLVHSGLSYDRKFPALLPQKGRLTELIIEQTHKDNFHPGLQTLQFLIAQRFWIISARRAIRRTLAQCFKCYKINPKPLQPFMGNLPSFRVSEVKAFSIVGVDYGGPFFVTLGKSRGIKSQKAYLCLFVCAATKAVHLELASDLSTEAFLGCLRRFIARRGRCSKIFSDQGTNFIGASKELQRMHELMQHSASIENIEWCFNPPSAPHFGGLFEAGIKSAKTHMYRIIGQQVLTFEELYTVFCQVESLLNSRPLCPMSSDPSDLSVLTPGHFLTLEPLTSLPDPNLQHLKTNQLSRWQLLQRFHQDIWKRWHTDYLNTLQQRNKWTTDGNILKENSVVLIKNDTASPLSWKLGRVMKLHPGKDGVARVATLRTQSGKMQRPLVKLCPLPEF